METSHVLNQLIAIYSEIVDHLLLAKLIVNYDQIFH